MGYSEHMKTTQLNIQGMTCGNCVRHVKEALAGVAAVETVEVSLDTNSAVVEHGDDVQPQQLIEAVEEEGYTAQLKSGA